MRAIALALLLVATPAAAQKIQDRHPAMIGLTFEQRWDGVREIPLTFEQRWEPVRRLLVRESFREVLRPQAEPADATAGSPARPRMVKASAILAAPAQASTPNAPAQATCLRHRLRTVWRGNRWNCRR